MPLQEHEVWIADIGAVTAHRWQTTADREWLSGAPDLVVEVLSSSNTAQEMNDGEQICFQRGCQEFWIVDPKLNTVRISTLDGKWRIYEANGDILLTRFGGKALRVADIFAAA